jgi:hypothetical protein
MKKIVVLLFTFSTLLLSCRHDGATTVSPNNVPSILSSGNWRITYFWDSDKDETSNFSGYSFVFNANGTIKATKGSSTVTGAWSTGNDDSKVKFIISFASPSDFTELSEDWLTIESTDKKIKLQHVSGGNGRTDYLTFEKN